MPHYDIDSHDFTVDQQPPKMILQHLRAHDSRMDEQRHTMALAKAAYTTDYFDYIYGQSEDQSDRDRGVEVEVNRLFGMISGYLAALYPRAHRPVLSPDPGGRGDPYKAQLALRRFLSSNRIYHRVMQCLRMALLYPGSGMSVGYNQGLGDALERTWIRPIPWWEMVLDRDVGDVEDERFRGRVYYRPLHEVRRIYDLPNLQGSSRSDFLQSADTFSGGNYNMREGRENQTAESDKSQFVRVLEMINLVDPITVEGQTYQGRFEVYLAEGGGFQDFSKPVWMGPLPFADIHGRGISHIMPLIFNHEPEYPYRAISHSKRVLPQIHETNAYRTQMARATRKDVRIWLMRAGILGEDDQEKLVAGEDGQIIEVDPTVAGREVPLDDVLVPVKNVPINANFREWMRIVDGDFANIRGQSPNASGVMTKATAFEVQTVQRYTESEYGMHASLRDEWLSCVCKVLLRAFIAAMQTNSASAGEFDGQAVDLTPDNAVQGNGKPPTPALDAILDEGSEEEAEEEAEEGSEDAEPPEAGQEEEEEEQEEEERDPAGGDLAEEAAWVLLADAAGLQQPTVDGSLATLRGTASDEGVIAVAQEVIEMLDENQEVVSITADDLNGNFEIAFADTKRTPINEAVMQQNLVGLMEPYNKLWSAAVQKQDPAVALLARRYMESIHDTFEMPRDLHPKNLFAELKEMPPPEPQPPPAGPQQQAAPAQGPPPEQGAPAAPASDEAALQQAIGMEEQELLQQATQMPPGQGIAMLQKLYSGHPEMERLLNEASGLPPDQQKRLLDTLAQGNV